MKTVQYIEKPYFLYNSGIVQCEVDYIKVHNSGNMFYYFIIDGKEVCVFPEFVFETEKELTEFYHENY